MLILTYLIGTYNYKILGFPNIILLASAIQCAIGHLDKTHAYSQNHKKMIGYPKYDATFDESSIQKLQKCETPDKREGICRSLAQCAIFYIENSSIFEGKCQISSDQEGACCPIEKYGNDFQNGPFSQAEFNSIIASGNPVPPIYGGSHIILKPLPTSNNFPIPEINDLQMQEMAAIAHQTFKEREEKIHDIIFNKKVTVPKNSPASLHQRFAFSSGEALKLGDDAQLGIEMTKNVMKTLQLKSSQETLLALANISLKGTPLEKACPSEVECDFQYPYRTMDGSCNSREDADWGKALTPFSRIIPPTYADGVDSPRVQFNGLPLPSPRLISQKFMPDENRPYKSLTLLLMQWGQFIDHDMAHASTIRGPNSTEIFCCTEGGEPLEENLRHPECIEIEIPSDDPFYSQYSQTCMSIARSLAAPRPECNLGPRLQQNQATHFIDGSHVYGTNTESANSLREGEGGRLSFQNYNGREYMPRNPDECIDDSKQRACFLGGDSRLNEQVHLATLHTLWFREHNRIARELEKLNPHWTDEIVYQETRRIVGALIQHITYNEFLPVILGADQMRKFQLQTSLSGHTNFYDPSVLPSITSSFASAAYRFGHSMIQGMIKMLSPFGVSEDIDLHTTQFEPYLIYDNMSNVVRGMTSQESQQIDHYGAESIKHHLFQGKAEFGFDLFAINIQRGREHGIAPYNEWRELCGLGRISSWEDLGEISDVETADGLRKLYTSVQEIDLFVGGLSEKPVAGSVLGETFSCLVADQFTRLRIGDRFYYEEQRAGFTLAQLEQLRRVSLARIICDNSDTITILQALVFHKASATNGRYMCSANVLPRMSLSPWKETKRSNLTK